MWSVNHALKLRSSYLAPSMCPLAKYPAIGNFINVHQAWGWFLPSPDSPVPRSLKPSWRSPHPSSLSWSAHCSFPMALTHTRETAEGRPRHLVRWESLWLRAVPSPQLHPERQITFPKKPVGLQENSPWLWRLGYKCMSLTAVGCRSHPLMALVTSSTPQKCQLNEWLPMTETPLAPRSMCHQQNQRSCWKA